MASNANDDTEMTDAGTSYDLKTDDQSANKRDVETLLYNMALDAYRVGDSLQGRQRKQLLVIQELKKGGSKAALEAVSSSASCPSLLPHEEELDIDPEMTQQLAIWVGLLLPGLRDNPTTVRTTQKGASVRSARNVKTYETQLALRVVAPTDKNNVNYYVLTKQDANTKLCIAHNVSMRDVFFFPEFRDDEAGSSAERKEQWPKLIQAALGMGEKDNKQSKTLSFDNFKFNVGAQRSVINEVDSLV